jgi:RND family efflux transporter MFP subunit
VKKVLSVFIALLVVGGGLYYGWKEWQASRPPAEQPLLPELTAKVERRTLVKTVDVAGDIDPSTRIEVKPEVSARIKKLHVSQGDQVQPGQILVELDDRELLTEKSVAERDLQGARYELEKARRDYERNKGLHAKKLVSDQIYLDAQTAQNVAENNFERSEARLQTVEDRLAKTKIHSPMGGMVLSVPVVEGQVVVAAASVNSGTLLMTIADLSTMIISAHVNQIDVARLKIGMEAVFRVDSIPGVEMQGRVSSIAPVAVVKNNVKGFTVVVLIEKPDARVRPGMTADVAIPVERADNVLAVPLSAVFNDEGRRKVAYVRTGERPGQVEKREVRVGVSTIDYAEILEGLAEQETVLLVRPAVQGS